jgi:hypothetical protein
VKLQYAAFAAILLLIGCSKGIDTMEDVKRGVIADVGKRADVSNMNVSVDSVSFRGKEADATVSFSAKEGGPPMTMQYTLEKAGTEWKVKDRKQGHGTEGAPGAVDPAQPLPPNHPAMPSGGAGGQAAPALPPNHPSVPPAK